MEWKSELERIQEEIIKAINYFKDYKKKRPTSEEILKFVNNGFKVDFPLFKDAMRELKLQRRIHNEMRNGTFTYFIPRVPEITLKVNKPEKKEPITKKSTILPIFPVESHREPPTSKIVDNYREPTPPAKKSVERCNSGNKVLVVNNNDSYEDYEEDENDDVGTLEKFIDKMMDRIDDVVVAEEPAPNILSLYEQRIFDLKSEVLFLRKLTTSNNTLLMDEVRFLRNELDAKNNVIQQLSNQFAVSEFDKKQVAKAEIQYELGMSKNSSNSLKGTDNDTSKALTLGNDTKAIDEEMFKRSMIGWMSNSWLKEVTEIASNKANAGRHIGFSSFNILDHVKTGVTPRHKGMSAHVGESNTAHALDIARMFDSFFGFMMDAPLKKMSNDVVITEVENEKPSLPVKKFVDAISPSEKSIETNTTRCPSSITSPRSKGESKENKDVVSAPHVNTLPDKSNKIDKEDMDGYRGWMSLNIMDLKPTNKKADQDDNLVRFGATDINLLTICENMSEKVNTINNKLRTFCDQRNINYDGKMDEPCLSLNKIPLNSNANNLLTNAYANRSMST